MSPGHGENGEKLSGTQGETIPSPGPGAPLLWAGGQEQAASTGRRARQAHTWKWSQPHSSLGLLHQQSLAQAFSHHTKTKIWPSYFR